MDFVLALHSHLPYVLHHGRWPHGSDWLCEAALDSYLPLLDALQSLEREGVAAPVTLGLTPVLANQLSHPSFGSELEAFFAQRLEACDAASASLASAGDQELVPLAGFWRERLLRLRGLFHQVGGDLVGAFRGLEGRGRIELISSAATHGFLPLLGRDESIRLQLFCGRAEHLRLFGRAPAGCWLPECAFRPAGLWRAPGAPERVRRGTDEHLREAGYRYFFVDAHLPGAGQFLGRYHDIPLGAERFDAERHDPETAVPIPERGAVRSPYRGYRMPAPPGAPSLVALVRDPRSTLQVWSRQQGYPGDEWYLEFHKIRWPGGLKLWRVSGEVDLGGKLGYRPEAARSRARDHARHFAGLLGDIAREEPDGRVSVAPFDTELFGHWWFEGVDFLADLYRALPEQVRPVTAGAHVAARPPRATVRLGEGSWGANGDFSMWMNERTSWTWKRLWSLEDAFWSVARTALEAGPAQLEVLAQAARSLLLAQASDWQFIISAGAAGDYAERRFVLHCEDAERLVAALRPGASPGALEEAGRLAGELRRRDDLFPEVIEAVAVALR